MHVGTNGRQFLLIDMECVGGFINSASTDKFFPNTRYHDSRPVANVKLCVSRKYPGLFYFTSAIDIAAEAELFASYTDDGGRKDSSDRAKDDDNDEDANQVLTDDAVTMSQAGRQQDAERNMDSDYELSQQ